MQNNRACQFAPFNALSGYYENIAKTGIKTINHTLTKKEIEDNVINTIKELNITDYVEIIHLNQVNYLKTIGQIRKITKKYIYIAKTQIEIDNILKINIIEKNKYL